MLLGTRGLELTRYLQLVEWRSWQFGGVQSSLLKLLLLLLLVGWVFADCELRLAVVACDV